MFEENERVELKEIYIPEIKKEVIAFTNTYGGTVYIGITDSGEVVGVDNVDSFENCRSLEQSLTFNAVSTELEARNIEFGDMQKQNIGILNADGLYTNLGLLVSDQCKHSIKVAVFQGTDKSIFRDRHEFCGSVFQQLKDAYKTVDFYNATKATFDELIRVDHRDYPVDAIREALLNAIIHRDYSFSGSIAINIYSDKMEIVSLGGLVPGLSVEAIMMGASQSRNEKLAALFYRMKLIESYGIGIGKMLSAYRDYPVKPSFDTVQGAFRAILPNVNTGCAVVNEAHQKALDYLSIHQSISRAEVEIILDVKLTRANAIIKEMLKLGYLRKVGAGKNTVYTIC